MSNEPSSPAQAAVPDNIAADRQLIVEARKRGFLATLGAFVKLSGPGWLQSAITLGGGSLAGSLYLGVIAGFSMMWLQPLAMIMGVIMLSAIAYVTLATGERPFRAINKHINPVLGWSWALATLAANLVWAMPQFALGASAIQQNLAPRLLGADAMNPIASKLLITVAFVVVCTAIVWCYDKGAKGIRIFEIILKIMVAIIVVSFFGVVIKMSLGGALKWGAILKGFIPDIKLLSAPAPTFAPYIEAVAPEFRGYWTAKIVSAQRDIMITAAATAVGINMTFLLPYSMLKKGWNKDFRGLAIFDLSTGLFIPFLLATSCVVLAAGAQFHTQPAPGLLGETDASGAKIAAPANVVKGFEGLCEGRLAAEAGAEALAALAPEEKTARLAALPEADRRMAAMLVNRDAFNLADSLKPLTGAFFAHYVFGIGVVGMAISTIIILMLINGFTLCEMLGVESKGALYKLGCFMPAIGMLGPFIWSKVGFYAAVPTSVFGMMLLPIAYLTFFMLMNQKKLLGDAMPRGVGRLVWNLLMLVASGLALFASGWSVWSKTQWKGATAVGVLIALAIVVHFRRKGKEKAA